MYVSFTLKIIKPCPYAAAFRSSTPRRRRVIKSKTDTAGWEDIFEFVASSLHAPFSGLDLSPAPARAAFWTAPAPFSSLRRIEAGSEQTPSQAGIRSDACRLKNQEGKRKRPCEAPGRTGRSHFPKRPAPGEPDRPAELIKEIHEEQIRQIRQKIFPDFVLHRSPHPVLWF